MDLGSPPHGSDLAGRALELQRVTDFVARLAAAPEPLVLVGESGVGKTVLWRHGCELARAAGCHLLAARPTEDGTAPGSALQDLLTGVSPSDDVDPQSIPRDDLQVAVRRLLSSAPVLVAVDDLQWVDEASLRSLHRLLRRRPPGSPVSLLATLRLETGAPPALDLHAWDAEVLTVSPLPRDELGRALRQHGQVLASEALTRIHEITGGNPLFALELGRHWDRGEQDAVRSSALSLLRRKLMPLAPQHLELVQYVALSGPTPAARLEPQLPGEDVLEVVEGTLSGVLEVDERYLVRCAHPIMATAARSLLTTSRRRRLHARIAEQEVDPVARAQHLAGSQVRPDPGVAAALEAAAALAARRGSLASAADLAAHSRRLTPQDAVLEHAARAAAEMTYRAAAGQYPSAMDIGDRLLVDLADGPLRSAVLTQRVLLEFGDAEQYLRAALADGPDDALRSRLLDLLGWQLGLFKGRIEEGMVCCKESMRLAEQGSDVGTWARAAATLAALSLLAGRPRHDLMARATTASRRTEPVESLLRVRPAIFEARQALWEGDPAAARPGLEDLRRLAAEMGSEFQRPYRLRDLAQLEIVAGRLQVADALVEEGLAAADQAGNEQAAVWLAHPAGLLAALRGQQESLDRCTGTLRDWAYRCDEPVRLVAVAEIEAAGRAAVNDWSGVVDQVRCGLERCERMGLRHPGFIPLLPRGTEAAAMSGDEVTARRWATQLAELADQLHSPGVRAMAVAAAAHRHLAAEEPAAAGVLYRDAITRYGALGQQLEVARLQVLAGIAALREQRRTEARTHLGRAVPTLVAQDVAGWTGLAAEHLDRLSRNRGPELTPTEQAVARHVTAGLRNQDIAAQMHLSISSVEAHLTKIYRKLGIPGRAALVAALSGDGASWPR